MKIKELYKALKEYLEFHGEVDVGLKTQNSSILYAIDNWKFQQTTSEEGTKSVFILESNR